MSLSYERNIHWYNLTCAGLFVVAAFAALGLVPSLGLVLGSGPTSFGPTQRDLLRGAVVESTFAVGLALIATHLRDLTSESGEPNRKTSGTDRVAGTSPPRSWPQELSRHLWGASDTRQPLTRTVLPQDSNRAWAADRLRRFAPDPKIDLGKSETADASTRPEADLVKAAVSQHAAVDLPATFAGTLDEQPDRPRPLPQSEIQALFTALSNGTLKHLEREPTVSEFASLVEFVNEGNRLSGSTSPEAIARLLRARRLNIYWGDDGWVFELPQSSATHSTRA